MSYPLPNLYTKLFLSAITIYVAAYFLLQLGLATDMPSDYAEQVVIMQHGWSWGYLERQPPLYTWLNLIFVAVFGLNMFAISALAYSLQLLTFSFVYLTARRLLHSHTLAILTTLSYLTIGFYFYRVHHNITHSLLAGCIIAATLYTLIRLTEKPILRWYIIFGLCCGIGIISKWNYVYIPIATLLAWAILPRFRHYLFNCQLIVSLVITLTIVAGPLWWLYDNQISLLSEATQRVNHLLQDSWGYWEKVLMGLSYLIKRSITFLFPYWLIFLIIFAVPFYRGIKNVYHNQTVLKQCDSTLLISAILVINLGITLLGILLGLITYLRSYWLITPLLLLPLINFIILEAGQPTVKQIKAFFITCSSIILLGIVLTWYQYMYAGDKCRHCRDLAPYYRLSALTPAPESYDGILLTNDWKTLGQLLLYYPQATGLTLERFQHNLAPDNNQAILIVYKLENDADQVIPSCLESNLNKLGFINIPTPLNSGFMELPLYASKSSRSFTYYYAYYPPKNVE